MTCNKMCCAIHYTSLYQLYTSRLQHMCTRLYNTSCYLQGSRLLSEDSTHSLKQPQISASSLSTRTFHRPPQERKAMVTFMMGIFGNLVSHISAFSPILETKTEQSLIAIFGKKMAQICPDRNRLSYHSIPSNRGGKTAWMNKPPTYLRSYCTLSACLKLKNFFFSNRVKTLPSARPKMVPWASSRPVGTCRQRQWSQRLFLVDLLMVAATDGMTK